MKQRSKSTFWAISLFCLTLTSCGYHLGTTEAERAISVPYVKGDEFGWLTSAIVRKINNESDLRYSNQASDLELRVCLNPPRDENVGFWYAPKKRGPGFTNIVVSMEGKVTLTATVEVYDAKSCCRLFGPCKITSFLEYDFNSDLTNINQHTFSLGQLEMHNIAKSYAERSLYDDLAEKIVDYVAHAW